MGVDDDDELTVKHIMDWTSKKDLSTYILGADGSLKYRKIGNKDKKQIHLKVANDHVYPITGEEQIKQLRYGGQVRADIAWSTAEVKVVPTGASMEDVVNDLRGVTEHNCEKDKVLIIGEYEQGGVTNRNCNALVETIYRTTNLLVENVSADRHCSHGRG